MELSTDAPLATWSDPAFPLTIAYPLALLYEIEFVASEGYRRIPHGGIEDGGVLYGRIQGDTVRIEAFRAIDCEHAFGPSFVLSASDIEKLRAQLRHAREDPELSGLTSLGWFISHSRSKLEVTDRECEWFDLLFPEPSQVLLLIKPEKFKPTRFSFAFHSDSRGQHSDLARNAFVLPLPGRSDGTKRERKRRREEPKAAEHRAQSLDEHARAIPVERATEPPQVSVSVPPSPKPQPARQRMAAAPTPVTPISRRPLLLWLCCITCCVLVLATGLRFYWKYGASPVSLHAARQGNRLLVSWPGETGANSGELRIQSGGWTQAMELNARQMRTGGVTISASGSDVSIELTAHHWLHDEHGLLRVLLPEQTTK
jgi:hypothetical protein